MDFQSRKKLFTVRLSLFTFKVVESRIRGIVKSHFPTAKDYSYFRGESMS
jgi:hypothetical protein